MSDSSLADLTTSTVMSLVLGPPIWSVPAVMFASSDPERVKFPTAWPIPIVRPLVVWSVISAEPLVRKAPSITRSAAVTSSLFPEVSTV